MCLAIRAGVTIPFHQERNRLDLPARTPHRTKLPVLL